MCITSYSDELASPEVAVGNPAEKHLVCSGKPVPEDRDWHGYVVEQGLRYRGNILWLLLGNVPSVLRQSLSSPKDKYESYQSGLEP